MNFTVSENRHFHEVEIAKDLESDVLKIIISMALSFLIKYLWLLQSWWIGFHHIGIAIEMLLGKVLVTRILISWGAVEEACRQALNFVLQLGIPRRVLEQVFHFSNYTTLMYTSIAHVHLYL
jgi:hypothetical protein